MSGPTWIVSVRGSAGVNGFEISVVREDNGLGKRSWGWFSDAKLLISHDGGHGCYHLTQPVWDKCVALAQEIADELNATPRKYNTCSGCGNSDPDKRCLGCLHPF